MRKHLRFGRALGIAGFGIDTSVASAEEVANAIEQQETKIGEQEIRLLLKAMKDRELTDEQIKETLHKGYGVVRVEDLLMSQYVQIIKKLGGK